MGNSELKKIDEISEKLKLKMLKLIVSDKQYNRAKELFDLIPKEYQTEFIDMVEFENFCLSQTYS